MSRIEIATGYCRVREDQEVGYTRGLSQRASINEDAAVSILNLIFGRHSGEGLSSFAKFGALLRPNWSIVGESILENNLDPEISDCGKRAEHQELKAILRVTLASEALIILNSLPA